MQKCSLSRIKSYEEKHYIKPRKKLITKDNQIQSKTIQVSVDCIKDKNNQTDKANFRVYKRIQILFLK